VTEVGASNSSATGSGIDDVGFLVPNRQGNVIILELVDPDDPRAVRNKDMILDHYARMINGKGCRNRYPPL
jgi:hypothetical protein